MTEEFQRGEDQSGEFIKIDMRQIIKTNLIEEIQTGGAQIEGHSI